MKPETVHQKIQQVREQRLTKLDLSNYWNAPEEKKLREIPAAVFELEWLQVLKLSDNQLSSLPDAITRLENLSGLYLSGNPLETPPIEVAERGIEAIRAYFQEQLDTVYEAKLIIVGEGAVGKTTLAKKIENANYFVPTPEDSTHGIEVKEWHFNMENGKDFRVNIWDFGGQEIYHATHQFFFF